MAYNLQVVVKQDSKGKDTFLLIEESGTICGIFNTEKDAMVAKPKIELNLSNFEEKGTLVFLKPKRRRKRKGRRKTKPSQKRA